MGMNIDLTPQREEWVWSKVAFGMCALVSEVVREALRWMDDQDRLSAVKLEQLRDDIRQGQHSGPIQAPRTANGAPSAKPSDRRVPTPAHGQNLGLDAGP